MGSTRYIKSLDGLRAIAILLVVFFHYFFILECGWIGVQLFFVLSGFLITAILLDTKNLSAKSYFKRFYWRRSVRIFPVYYLYLFGITLIFLVANIPETFGMSWKYLYTYTYNFAPIVSGYFYDGFFTHFWSLAVEEQFYLLWPLVIFIFDKKALKIVIISIILLSPVVRLLLTDWFINNGYELKSVGELTYRFTFSQLDAFAFGAAIPVFKFKLNGNKRLALLLASLAIFLIVGFFNYHQMLALGYEIGISSLGYPIGSIFNYQHIWSYTIINIFTFSLIIYLISDTKSSILSRILENSVLVYIGKISYGIYIYHWLLFTFHKLYIHQHMPNALISFIVYFAVVMIISSLSWYFFEKICLRLKDEDLLKRYLVKLKRLKLKTT